MAYIVGILNITPDSFSDGGAHTAYKSALEKATQLFTDGAHWVDVGAEATNPKALPVTANQEWQRLKPILPELIKKYPGKISLDTRHATTAKKFCELGGTILNDISGFQDPAMVEVAAEYKPWCIINHFPGYTTQEVHEQHIDNAETVLQDLQEQKQILLQAGVQPDKIILDPGIGFGKTMRLNEELLDFPRLVPDSPVMIGYSKKRFLGENRFETAPNIAAGQRTLQAGAAYIRVHDVAIHKHLP